MIRLSTGLKNLMINLWSTDQLKPFTGFFINVYSGQRPASPDEAVTDPLLITFSINGDGTPCVFEATPTAGVLEKGAGTWKATGLVAGTASWFRLYNNADSPSGASTTLKRLDGTVGTTNADLNLSSTNITVGAPVTVSTAQFTLPSE